MSVNWNTGECYCEQCTIYCGPPGPPDPFDWCEEGGHKPHRSDGSCWCYRSFHPAEFGAKLLMQPSLVYAHAAPRFDNVIWTGYVE